MTKKAVSDLLATAALMLCGGSVATGYLDHGYLVWVLLGVSVPCAVAAYLVDRSRARAAGLAAAPSDADVDDADDGDV